ncbi:MAG: hypothetical protein KKD77_23740 [Gammaproteobacteria bacterium]|nr:hypothetical protein [Gammaproteobacteria bacterium]
MKQALRPRTAKILATCKVLKRDQEGRVVKVQVPGHNGRVYHVIVRRINGLSVECLQQTPLGDIPCQAAENWHICYHARQALVVAAHETAGRPVCFLRFHRVRPTEGKLANIGKGFKPVRLYRDNKPREFVEVRPI